MRKVFFQSLWAIGCIAAVAVAADATVSAVNATEEGEVANATAEALREEQTLWERVSGVVWTLLGVVVFTVIAVKNAWDTRSNNCGGVRCAPQEYIRISKTTLGRALAGKYGDRAQRRQVKRLLGLLDVVLERKYAPVQDELVADYDAFDPTAARGNSAAEGSAGAGDEYAQQRRQRQETRFLRSVQLLLERAGFVPLTQSVADFALAEDYILTVPVDVNWDAFDSDMLRNHRIAAAADAIDAKIAALRSAGKKKAGSSSSSAAVAAALQRRVDARMGETSEALFEHKDEVLLYHRGLTLDVTRGKLMSEKIDALTERAISWAFGFVRRLLDALPFVPKKAPAPDVLDMSGGAPAERCTTVQRVRLQSKVLNPANFLLETTVQEPAFEEVFLLWRPKPESDTVAQMALSGLATSHADRAHYIFAKAMRGIPLADLELAFPEKHIHMKPFDLIMMVSGVCTALIALASQLFAAHSQASSAHDMSSLVLTAAVAAVMKTVSSYTANMNYYNSVVQAGLNARTMGNNRCALTYLVDSVKAQEYKQAAVALVTLLLAGGTAARADLQQRCDTLLMQIDCDRITNPVPCSLQLDDALATLRECGLVDDAAAAADAPHLATGDMDALATLLEDHLAKQLHESVQQRNDDD